MKILFSLIVLMAIAYLAVPQVTIDQFKTYLPQQKIEQSAGSLLANVDTKLNNFKQELSKRQENRISILEEKIAALEHKILQDIVVSNASSLTKQFVHEEAEVATLGNSDNYDQLLSKANTKTALAANLIVNNALTDRKKQKIQRQASLQELAERMNRTSLLAATH